MIDLKTRYRGCLLGLAVGDAVGTTVEFAPPGSFPPVTDMVGGGPFRLQAGEWTDDTSMALCLAESLLERGSFDATDQTGALSALVPPRPFVQQRPLLRHRQHRARRAAPLRADGRPLAGSTDSTSAGNGSIMRLAAVPLFFAADAARAVAMSGESSRPTHGATACVDACRYLGGLILGALRGEPKDALLSPRYRPAGAEPWADLDPDIAAIANGSFAHRSPPDIKGSGYVVRSLEAALWAFRRADSFAEGCLLAVNLGDDADTTAAVYGQLAGAYYGEAGIPAPWRERLAQGALITDFADRLYKAAQ